MSKSHKILAQDCPKSACFPQVLWCAFSCSKVSKTSKRSYQNQSTTFEPDSVAKSCHCATLQTTGKHKKRAAIPCQTLCVASVNIIVVCENNIAWKVAKNITGLVKTPVLLLIKTYFRYFWTFNIWTKWNFWWTAYLFPKPVVPSHMCGGTCCPFEFCTALKCSTYLV